MERELFASPFVSEPSSESNREKQLDWEVIGDPMGTLQTGFDEFDLPQDSFMSQHDSMNIPTSSPLYTLPILNLDSGLSLGATSRYDTSEPLEALVQFVKDSRLKPTSTSTRTGKIRERRNNFTPKQRETLNKWLVEHSKMPYPSQKEIQSLSTLTGLTIRQIRVYLTNGRIRLLQRRKQTKSSDQ